jgi:hypothetical protein
VVESVTAMLLSVNVGAAGLLLVAGAHKLVTPHQLVMAIKELTPSGIGVRKVQALAGLEVLTAVLLLIPRTHLAGAVSVGVLGFGFALAGSLGLRKGSAVDCGCFGGSGRPLGALNVAVGLGCMGAAAGNAIATNWAGVHESVSISVSAAAAVAVLITLIQNRQQISMLVIQRRLTDPSRR